MPAPIVLSTLTPETKRVPNPPAGQPVIATKAEFRDGGRVASGGGGDPAPGSGPGFLTDAQWHARLARTLTGTPDPSFDPYTDITFIGAFRMPYYSSAATNSRTKSAVCYKAPDGSNGPNGSLFFGGEGGISEVQIPELLVSSDHTQLNAGTVLQNWVDLHSRADTDPARTGGNETKRTGWLKIIGGKLYASFYAYYSQIENNTNLLVIDNPSNLANSPLQGLLDMNGEDRVVTYCSAIPADKQAMFGGCTYFAGTHVELALAARTSFGPSFYGWNPENIGVMDTSVPTTQFANYPQGNTIDRYDTLNQPMNDYYASVLGEPIADYIARDPATRETSFDAFPLPDESLRRHVTMVNSKAGGAFIVPGTDTLMYVGNNRGSRYGLGYKGRTIEGSNLSGGYHAYSNFDSDNVFWTMNVNDIANAISPHDPDYIEYGIFDENRWRLGRENSKPGAIAGVDFDPSTGRLYVFQDRLEWPQSTFETQYVISVYQVGGGV